MAPPGIRASPSKLPMSGSALPGKASCQRISITRQKPKNRNTRPVTAYQMPMTLWSVENTYLRQKPSSWCSACSSAPAWCAGAGAVAVVCMVSSGEARVSRSLARSVAGRGEREVGARRLVGGDGHGRGLDAELLVPGLDLVAARRQVRDRVLAVL